MSVSVWILRHNNHFRPQFSILKKNCIEEHFHYFYCKAVAISTATVTDATDAAPTVWCFYKIYWVHCNNWIVKMSVSCSYKHTHIHTLINSGQKQWIVSNFFITFELLISQLLTCALPYKNVDLFIFRGVLFLLYTSCVFIAHVPFVLLLWKKF